MEQIFDSEKIIIKKSNIKFKPKSNRSPRLKLQRIESEIDQKSHPQPLMTQTIDEDSSKKSQSSLNTERALCPCDLIEKKDDDDVMIESTATATNEKPTSKEAWESCVEQSNIGND